MRGAACLCWFPFIWRIRGSITVQFFELVSHQFLVPRCLGFGTDSLPVVSTGMMKPQHVSKVGIVDIISANHLGMIALAIPIEIGSQGDRFAMVLEPSLRNPQDLALGEPVVVSDVR